MTNKTQTQGRESKPSLLERFGQYLAGLEGRRISKTLHEKGFYRTDDRRDDVSLQELIARTYNEHNSDLLTELYIAPGILFGETEHKYVVYMRTKSCRESQIDNGRGI